MGLYRFLNSQHVSTFLKGKIRFGSLQRYRLLEAVTNDKWIGDSKEYSEEALVRHIDSASPNDRPTFEALNRDGNIYVGDASGVTISNTIVGRRYDGYILSLSIGDLSKLKAAMCGQSSLSAYDGCIEILDVATLCDRIWHHSTFEGKPVPNLFSSIHHGVVTYDWRIDDFTPREISPSPFRKQKQYEAQSEYRVFIEPKHQMKHNYITFELNGLGDVLREVPLGLPKSDHRASGKAKQDKSTEDHINTIKRLASEWHDMRFSPDLALDHSGRYVPLTRSQAYENWVDNHMRPTLTLSYWALRESNPERYQSDSIDQIILDPCPRSVLGMRFWNYAAKQLS